MNNIKYQRMMAQKEPIPVAGAVVVPQQRRVLWKNVCLLGDEQRECMVEMSKNKLKFYIVAVDLAIFRYHIIELWSAQAKKLLQACDGSLEKLMTYLEFRYGKLQIKDYDLLI